MGEIMNTTRVMTDPMELVGRLENFDGGHQKDAYLLIDEAAACIREMVEKIEALKRSVERYRDQVTVERKAYRNLLADYEGRPLPPAPGAEA